MECNCGTEKFPERGNVFRLLICNNEMFQGKVYFSGKLQNAPLVV